MRTRNEHYAYVTLHGDFDPEEITRKIGLKPTKSWKKGDRAANRDHIRVFSRWSLASKFKTTDPLEAHIRDVFSQLESRKTVVRALSKDYGGTLQLAGYFWQGFPGLHFSVDISEAIASFGLAVDFDFYGLYSHRREDTGFTFDPSLLPGA
jgi:hypothetical protein